MKATKIKMYDGHEDGNSLLEIDKIYISGCTEPGFFKKASVHDFLKEQPGTIQVDIYPYPNLIPRTSVKNEKYVASQPNSTTNDNLLKLPRE